MRMCGARFHYWVLDSHNLSVNPSTKARGDDIVDNALRAKGVPGSFVVRAILPQPTTDAAAVFLLAVNATKKCPQPFVMLAVVRDRDLKPRIRRRLDRLSLFHAVVVVIIPIPQHLDELAGFPVHEHPAHREIISMGEPAVPLILERMQLQGGHWFHALREMTNANPMKPDDRGNVGAMQAAWLEWGERNGYA